MNYEIINDYLRSSGYDYYCFVSWPHKGGRDVTKCAQIIKHQIEDRLKSIFDNPEVFIDATELKVGIEWEKKIATALCKSVAMVAICAPIYYSSKHEWCGQEWAGMDMIKNKRFPEENLPTIIPVIVRKRESDSLPETLLKKHYIDVSKVQINGERYYKTIEFRNKLEEIIAQICNIASYIFNYQIEANCTAFTLPKKSAFLKYKVKNQPLPFRGK